MNAELQDRARRLAAVYAGLRRLDAALPGDRTLDRQAVRRELIRAERELTEALAALPGGVRHVDLDGWRYVLGDKHELYRLPVPGANQPRKLNGTGPARPFSPLVHRTHGPAAGRRP